MRTDDIQELMLADVHHLVKAHDKQIRQGLKQFPISQLIGLGIKVIKDQKQEESSIACSDLEISCDWHGKTDNFMLMLFQALEHWEQAHAEDLRGRIDKDGYGVLVPFLNAIKRQPA
jgi:predicted small metal-binding protein